MLKPKAVREEMNQKSDYIYVKSFQEHTHFVYTLFSQISIFSFVYFCYQSRFRSLDILNRAVHKLSMVPKYYYYSFV